MSPYFGNSFFEFFVTFFTRLFSFEAFSRLAFDELQIFVLSLIGITTSVVGCFLVLRKLTMLANALSHTALLGIVLAFMFGPGGEEGGLNLPLMTFAALITGIFTTLATETLINVASLKEDASCGLVFTTLFSLGIVLATIWTKSTHIGTEVVLGNADILHLDDLKMSAFVAFFILSITFFFFKEISLTTFDPLFAASVGIFPWIYHYLLAFQTAFVTVSSFRAVGVLLVLAFFVIPALTARLLTHRLRVMVTLASCLSVCSVILGVALSRHAVSYWQTPLSTAGVIIIWQMFFFFISAIFYHFSALKKNIWVIPSFFQKKITTS